MIPRNSHLDCYWSMARYSLATKLESFRVSDFVNISLRPHISHLRGHGKSLNSRSTQESRKNSGKFRTETAIRGRFDRSRHEVVFETH
jgi:hypothetical protein